MKISKKAAAIQPSATLAITGRAKQKIAEGLDVVSLSAGEPDFDVPEPAASAAIEAIRSRTNRYTPVLGLPPLRAAIVKKLAADNGLSYQADEIIVSVGAKQALFNALLCLLDEGDEVLVPKPYWVSYPEQIGFAGGVCREIDCPADSGYALTADAVAAACTDATRVMMINSPNNPTGAVYDRAELEKIAAVARERDLFVISDEIYEKLLYDGAEHCSIAVFPDMKERTLVVNGFSKAWAMPGWRIGYAAGPGPLIKAMSGIQGHATSNAPSLVQHAAIAALGSDGAPVRAMAAEFARRRAYVAERLAGIDGLQAPPPRGAFYALVSCAACLPAKLDGQPLTDDHAFAMALLEKANVAVVPGTPFGAPGTFRMSFAASLSDLEKGLDRIQEFVGRLERR